MLEVCPHSVDRRFVNFAELLTCWAPHARVHAHHVLDGHEMPSPALDDLDV
jgi:hypothetical protein